jgi:hypothetical protein
MILIQIFAPNGKLLTERRVLTLPATVGRSHDCSVWISDPTLSLQHLQIVAEGKEILFKDLGSRNGLYAQGLRLPELRLAQGSLEFHIGQLGVRVSRDLNLDAGTEAFDPTQRSLVPLPQVKSLRPWELFLIRLSNFSVSKRLAFNSLLATVAVFVSLRWIEGTSLGRAFLLMSKESLDVLIFVVLLSIVSRIFNRHWRVLDIFTVLSAFLLGIKPLTNLVTSLTSFNLGPSHFLTTILELSTTLGSYVCLLLIFFFIFPRVRRRTATLVFMGLAFFPLTLDLVEDRVAGFETEKKLELHKEGKNLQQIHHLLWTPDTHHDGAENFERQIARDIEDLSEDLSDDRSDELKLKK